MSQNPAHSPNPDPSNPSVDASPPPGATPPNSDQMSGSSPDAREAPNMGPVSGNRTPMIIALVVLGFMVLAVAIITGASFFPS